MRILSNDELDLVAGGDTGSLLPGPDLIDDVTSYASFGGFVDTDDKLKDLQAAQAFKAWKLDNPGGTYADYKDL